MKSLVIFIESHPVLITIILAAFPFLFPQFRKLIRAIFARLQSGKILTREKLDLILVKVTNIETEIQFSNDTSTKQEVALLKKRSHLSFWQAARPSIEMDGDAQVMHVSETLCRLLGVFTPADLYHRNWLRCVESGRVDEFLGAFTETVKFKSDFDFTFRLQTKSGEPQGEWKMILSDVTPQGYSKTIYSGFFKPLDERAKEIASNLHWSK
jgi:hypothetical protein